jgi:hypothetical protein
VVFGLRAGGWIVIVIIWNDVATFVFYSLAGSRFGGGGADCVGDSEAADVDGHVVGGV